MIAHGFRTMVLLAGLVAAGAIARIHSLALATLAGLAIVMVGAFVIQALEDIKP